MQAGTVQTDSKRGKATGPVLKTIVNREPRPTGPVIETWLGLDESGSFYVPDLRGFSVSVAATSLPENALISVGNTSETFLERAARRSGDPLIPQPDGGHAHHRGLTALDDVAPHTMVEIRRFFIDYKVLEEKEVEVEPFHGRERALQVIRQALEDYRALNPPR